MVITIIALILLSLSGSEVFTQLAVSSMAGLIVGKLLTLGIVLLLINDKISNR